MRGIKIFQHNRPAYNNKNEICKAPTLLLKALRKHTHIMYIEMENVIQKKRKNKYISTSVPA